MPTYPANKTYRGGFYNNKNVNGVDDRVYTAEDIRKPYDVIYSDGVKPEADGTAGESLKVSVTGNMTISVANGHAKLGGAWFTNESPYIITLDTAGSEDRYDCVIVRNDDSDDVRAPQIYIKSLSAVPTIADLTRTDKIYEICLAYIRVPALASDITSANLVDTRDDGELSNVMSGVGATVVRVYRGTYFSEIAGQTIIPIPTQYNRTRDDLSVMVEGRVFALGEQYTINGNESITLAIGLPVVGTRVDFAVSRNVNAAGAGTVVQEVGELLDDMTAVKRTLKHHHYCNGATDNVLISQIVQDFLSGGTTYDSIRLVVHGHFGATSPVTGEGTQASPYIWLRVGHGSAVNRRVFLDFTDCDRIVIACADSTYNTIFFGLQGDIIGADVIATGGAQITMFSTAAATHVNADKCRLWITSQAGYIARGGTFRDCRVSVTTTAADAYCFNVLTGGLLRLFGGEYYAYAPTANFSAVVYVNAQQLGAVVNTYSINCPTFARSGYVQTYAINCLTEDACCSFTDTITALPIEAAGMNIRGTIPKSIAGTI